VFVITLKFKIAKSGYRIALASWRSLFVAHTVIY